MRSLLVRSLLLATVAGLLAAAPALAQNGEPSVFYRLYYSYAPYFQGDVKETPADPKGNFDDEPLDWSDKLELEAVVWGHLGFSVTRLRWAREFFNNQGDKINESAQAHLANLTLYASEMRHDAWNLFIGIGYGELPKYRIKVNSRRVDESLLHRNLIVRRNFAGVEYTFERLGVRYEINQITAENSSGDQTAEFDGMIQYLTFYIPLN